MERSWSALLATDKFPYFRPKVRCFKKEVCGYFGNIIIKWKTMKSTYICQARLLTFADMQYIKGCTVRPPDSNSTIAVRPSQGRKSKRSVEDVRKPDESLTSEKGVERERHVEVSKAVTLSSDKLKEGFKYGHIFA